MSTDSRVFNVLIEKIEKHSNADTLSIVNVFGGYPCIVRTGDFQVGDIASYIPVDMLVPNTPIFSFLFQNTKINTIRIKAKKLRGIFSMGILVKAPPNTSVNDDVTDILGVTKWEPEEINSKSVSRPGGKFLPGVTENDPGFLPAYTDIENVRKYRSILEGIEVVVTEKIHGANAGFVYHTAPPYNANSILHAKKEGKIPVRVTSKTGEIRYTLAASLEHASSKYIDWQVDLCDWCVFESERCEPESRLWIRSRRQFKKPNGGGIWADVAKKYSLEEVLKVVCSSIGIYGEVYGQVQDLTYGYGDSVDLTPFDSYDLHSRKYLDYDNFVALIDKINVELSNRNLPLLKPAPLLYRGKFDYDLIKTLAEGTTVLGNGLHVREGVVIKPVKEMWDSRLGRVILKLPGEGYLTR